MSAPQIVAPLPNAFAGTETSVRIRALRSIAWTVIAGLALAALRTLGAPLHTPGGALVLVVALLAARNGRPEGLASAFTSVIVAAVFYATFDTGPVWSRSHIERLVIMLFVAPTIAWFVGNLHSRVNSVTRALAEAERGRLASEDAMKRAMYYRTLAEALPQIVWSANADGWLDFYNQRWYDYTGMTEEESLVWGWGPAIHPDDFQRCLERWKVTIKEKVPYEVEYRFRRASDGEYRWHLGRALPLCDDDGNVVKWIGTSTDIHDQREAADAIRKWELVFRHSSWGVLIVDHTTRLIAAANPAVERMHGYESGEMIGFTANMTFAPEALAEFHEREIELVQNGRVIYESVHVRKDGSRFPLLIDSSAVTDDAGRVLYRVSNYLDLSERRAAEAAREGAETRFRIVQDASPDSFVLWDVITDERGEMVDARVSYANPAAHRLAGRAIGTIDGAHLDDVFPGVLASDRFPMYTEVFRTGQSKQATFKHSKFDIWLRVVVMKVDNGLGILATDVTKEKAAELVLRRSRDDLERLVAARTRELHAARDLAVVANRAKSAFLSRASHELRTPLNSVIGFSGILLKNRSGNLDTSELGFVERVSRNGKHLLGLVNDLLDLSKIEAGKVDLDLAPVSLYDLVHEVRDTLEPRASEIGLALVTRLPDVGMANADLLIITDEQRLRQVLLNLVGNAIKYTASGSVTLRVVADRAEVPQRVDVIDTGHGIAHDKLEAIFEPFVIGDAPPQGEDATGLGLAISRSLCDLMGFRLTVASRIGKGTTFSIHLTSQ